MSDEHIELWGREIERGDFVKGHDGENPRQPTPEGGQAGIAQGHIEDDGDDTFATRDQFSQSGTDSPSELERQRESRQRRSRH